MSEELKNWLSKQENHLALSWDNQAFIDLIIQQINKDISPYSSIIISLEQNNKGPVKSLILKQIKTALVEIDKKQSNNIPQLMYTIDVPESIFNEILMETNSLYDNLAEVILIREAFKVWLRLNY